MTDAHEDIIDPNSEIFEAFAGTTLQHASEITYSQTREWALTFFKQREDIDQNLLANHSHYVLPKSILTDKLMNALFQFDFLKHKTSCSIYHRHRKLRGYISHCLKYHNMNQFNKLNDRKRAHYPECQSTFQKLKLKEEFKRANKVSKKTIFTLKEDAALRKRSIDLNNPCDVQIQLGIQLAVTQACRPKTFSRLDGRTISFNDKRIDDCHRPEATIKAFGVKNDPYCDNIHKKGTIVFVCACPSFTDHNKSNTECPVTLLEKHKNNIELLDDELKEKLPKLQKKYKNQMAK